MKKTLLLCIVLIATTLLLSGCGKDTPLETNETLEEPNVTEPTAPEDTASKEEPESPEEVPEVTPEEPEEPVDPVMVLPEPTNLPESFNVILTGLSIQKTVYDDDEEYELRMILSKDQQLKISTATISYTPLCDEPSRMLVTVNDALVSSQETACGDATEHVISGDLFIEGPNTILFQNKVEESYELSDIKVVFSYTEGEPEILQADGYVFQPSDVDRREIKDLAIAAMVNEVTRTFSLSEEQLVNDLYFEFDTSNRDGELIILLNGRLLFEGKPKKDGHTFSLPHEHLVVGKNTLTFIAEAEQ